MIVRSIRYVDEVILGSPLVMTKDFIERHKIDCVVHGFSNIDDFEKQKEFFREIDHIFYQIPYYRNTSTTEIIEKINNQNK